MKAIWNGTTIAESDDTVVVENNHYFPADAIKQEYFKPSITHSHCPLDVEGKTNPDAAWYYPAPLDAAKQIKGRVAFWKGVVVKE